MSTMCRETAGQRGFAIISALFILVALAALGTFIAIVASTQHRGNMLDLDGSRAYFAARSGIEWGAAKAVNTVNASACTATQTLSATVNGMTVTVGCTVVASGDTTEAGLGTIYRIVATACNFPVATACPGAAGPNYVERRLEALVEK